MHIPDGFVSGPINAACAVVTVGAVGYSLRRIRLAATDSLHKVPLLATTAAFIFAAQMLNFPIGGGTSGHFLGAVTAAALLGPCDACIVMTLVLVIQGLFFADGGVTALGTNIFNMGIIGGIGGYWVMRGVRALLPGGRKGYLIAAAGASWLSVVAASSACAVELAMSGTSPLRVALPAMAGTHAIIGIGESLIAAAVLTAAAVARPDIIPAWARLGISGPTTGAGVSRKRIWAFAATGAIAAMILAVFLSPYASSAPDGLEKVGQDKGFIEKAAAEDQVFWKWSPMPDYSVKGIDREGVSTGTAGFIGTIFVFGGGLAVIKLAMRRSNRVGNKVTDPTR